MIGWWRFEARHDGSQAQHRSDGTHDDRKSVAGWRGEPVMVRRGAGSQRRMVTHGPRSSQRATPRQDQGRRGRAHRARAAEPAHRQNQRIFVAVEGWGPSTKCDRPDVAEKGDGVQMRSENAQAACSSHGRGSRPDFELAKGARKVGPHGPRGDEERRGHVSIREPLGDQGQDLPLSPRKTGDRRCASIFVRRLQRRHDFVGRREPGIPIERATSRVGGGEFRRSPSASRAQRFSLIPADLLEAIEPHSRALQLRVDCAEQLARRSSGDLPRWRPLPALPAGSAGTRRQPRHNRTGKTGKAGRPRQSAPRQRRTAPSRDP